MLNYVRWSCEKHGFVLARVLVFWVIFGVLIDHVWYTDTVVVVNLFLADIQVMAVVRLDGCACTRDLTMVMTRIQVELIQHLYDVGIVLVKDDDESKDDK